MDPEQKEDQNQSQKSSRVPYMEPGQEASNGNGSGSYTEEAAEAHLNLDPLPKCSDREYRNQSLDEKIFLRIETLYHRIDDFPNDPDLTCCSMEYKYLESPHSLKTCVEQLCCNLQRDLTDTRIELQNIEHIMNSPNKSNWQLIFSKKKASVVWQPLSPFQQNVKGNPGLSAWLAGFNVNDCKKHMASFENLNKLIQELITSIAQLTQFYSNLQTLKVFQNNDTYMRAKQQYEVCVGINDTSTKLNNDNMIVAGGLLTVFREELEESSRSNKFLDPLSLFGKCCYFDKNISEHPDEALLALKHIKKYMCCHARYYKLRAEIKNIYQDSLRNLKAYCSYEGCENSGCSSKTDLEKLSHDLCILQRLIQEVHLKWGDFDKYLSEITKAERNRNLRRAVRRDVHHDVPKMDHPPHGNPATREDAVYLPHNYEAGQSYTNGDHIWTCL